ncbi:MAG: NAD-dependent epimerase/dehydratase family protein [Promethearchaeota archaeon]|nr:MAG: NAD-dependent epimerase/dehydratase family protein [Candidatus Lokiarchaeota archaeon]
MKNALITGADGFLGSHLTDFLLEREFSVFALKRPGGEVKNLTHYMNGKQEIPLNEKQTYLGKQIQIPSQHDNLIFLECDLNDAELLEFLIKEVKPNIIYHFGAQPYVIPSWKDPRYTINTNVIGTINLFEPVKKYDIECKVIVACSSAEYGTTTETIKRPLKESDPLKAVHPYGISKIATELLARQYFLNFGFDVVNLRFFNQTGPRKVDDACSDFIQRVAQIELGLVEPFIEVGNLEPYRDITGIRDSIRAIWLATTKGKSGETYNVCSSRKTQIRRILEIALSFSSKDIEVRENTPKKLRKTDEDIILGDNSKIKNELGFKITQPINEILKEMYTYWIDFYTLKENEI